MKRIACFLLLALAMGCSSAPAPEPEAAAPAAEKHELHGKVLQLRPGDINAAVVEHDEIAGFMDAMTMTYPVKDPADFAKLHEGDYITADVMTNDDGFYLENINVVDPPPPTEDTPAK